MILFYTLLIVCFMTIIFFLIRLLSIKKEMKKITKQLKSYNHQRTNKKIDIALLDQPIESLGTEINKLVDMHIKEKRERIQAENELKQMIANMSHDLRTPLTSIVGYIHLAESDEIPEVERKEYISIAKKRAKRLDTLLSDFFELSMIESIDYQLKLEKTNLKKIVIDVLVNFYDRFNEKKIEPIINLPDNDIFISSDESAVIRVIENLLSNSLKHSNGDIMISLEEKESKARLVIRNDAPSLTENEVERIFNRFYMADRSRSEKNTGLGLSIVKSLMEKMNGTTNGYLDEGQLSIICEWESVKNE